MTDLGLMLAWSAVQASLVLATTAAIYLRASRRSPASGAWAASLGLGLALAVGLLSMAMRTRASSPTPIADVNVPPAVNASSARGVADPAPQAFSGDRRPLLSSIREAWSHLDRTAAAPADICRSWASMLAVVGLAGIACGVLRLLAGLWAVHLVRVRSRRVDDAELLRLLSEVRSEMLCKKRVEFRESAELTAPATAGWRSAVILLPDDWRSWDEDARRAVLSHELAHILREDYITGVVARAAQALYFYNPLVHWLAARLRLEQELAADALGAKFSGGNDRYLHSLSRLALRQDGRPPCWPARAFLPVKGTLIRRIDMLRDEKKSPCRPWAGLHRASAASLMLSAAIVASLLHGPARADDRDGQPFADAARRAAEPFDLSYVMDEDSQSFVAFRPAAAFQLAGMELYRTMLNLAIGQQWALAANQFKFDPTKPGQTAPKVEMFEQVTADIRIARVDGPKPNGRIFVTRLTCRTAEPVDWKAVFRLFGAVVSEVRDGNGSYFRVTNLPTKLDAFFFCPDERTLVVSGEERPADSEKRMLKLLHRDRAAAPPTSVFAQGKDWDRLLGGLLVVGLDNRGGKLTKVFRTDDPTDFDIDPVPAFEHADLWAIGLEDDEQIRFRAVGTCPDAEASGSTVRAVTDIFDQVRRQIEAHAPSKTPLRPEVTKAEQMTREFFRNTQVTGEGRSVLLQSTGAGSLADLAWLFAAGVVN
ncbi:M56 family metallopeptidase [Paludisphaera mucosa]|uniref:M56 family metallopeptidase n=1 Tax=Paludisphaera mucosa TaxID=3030827 RepID=A0ABT6F8T2_9BACT|nr:M56 family metallopeptidase [Paludisphaera mucosa]MDG3003999.1 M56 family metallopeptidase [Paludisphaera mucosa]